MDMLIRASERLIKAVMEAHPSMNMDDKKEEELYLAYHNCKDAVKYERERTLTEQPINCNLPHVSKMLPVKATHCTLGNVIIIGVRIECSENNNLMYFCKFEDKTLGWVYDYDIKV